MSKIIDMTGWVMKEHGVPDSRLTVLFKDDKYKQEHNLIKGTYWRCLCSCGKETTAEGRNIRLGLTKSCKCLSKETTSEVRKKDITGMKFGKLTAIKNTGKLHNGVYLWECICECGNTCIKPINKLMIGEINSCGCLNSKGEMKIQKILEQHKISFEKQKYFDSCRVPKTGRVMYFDFYINDSFLLEFDGEQHYNSRIMGRFTEERVVEIKKRDLYKNQWCKENNIPLKRIPYWVLDNLTIEDILSDRYLIKEEEENV